MRARPDRVLVENVVGFETSETRDALIRALETTGYAWREFVGASPADVGVPNARPRYYALAKKREVGGVRRRARAVRRRRGERRVRRARRGGGGGASAAATARRVPGRARGKRRPDGAVARDGEVLEVARRRRAVVHAVGVLHRGVRKDGVRRIGPRVGCVFVGAGERDFVDAGGVRAGPSRVALRRRARSGTSAPREIASLHGLGDDFALPSEVLTRRQLYFALGNSISVDVVSSLMRHLFDDAFF